MEPSHTIKASLDNDDVPRESIDSITSGTTPDASGDRIDHTKCSNEPQSPRLPTISPFFTSSKRDHNEYLASSSDVPLFSSVDLPLPQRISTLEKDASRGHGSSWRMGQICPMSPSQT